MISNLEIAEQFSIVPSHPLNVFTSLFCNTLNILGFSQDSDVVSTWGGGDGLGLSYWVGSS
jgi:hypothetical protein